MLAILTLLISACDDGIIIGENLLDDEEIGTNAKEDFDLGAKTLAGKKLNTLATGRDNRSYNIGTIVDPVFGTYSADAYFAPRYAGLPDFYNSTADSIVLVLQYDTVGVYGDTLATHELAVHRVTEDFVTRDSIDSEETIGYDAMSIGSKTFTPNTRDSITLLSRTDVGSTYKAPAQIRIRLSQDLASELLADSSAAKSDTALLESLKGLHISANSNDKSMLAVRMDDATYSSINLYYTQEDTAKRVFTYPLRTEVFANIVHDYSGSPVEQFIDSDLLGDSLIFSQGLKGLDPQISFPDLSFLQSDILINKATLTLTVAELEGDFPLDLYPVGNQLLASKLDDNDDRILIQDLVKTGDLNTGFILFGGTAEKVEQADGTTVTQYIMNITDYLKAVVDEDEQDPKIILTPFFRQESPRNAVIYGPGHSKYPVKLRITYTEL